MISETDMAAESESLPRCILHFIYQQPIAVIYIIMT